MTDSEPEQSRTDCGLLNEIHPNPRCVRAAVDFERKFPTFGVGRVVLRCAEHVDDGRLRDAVLRGTYLKIEEAA